MQTLWLPDCRVFLSILVIDTDNRTVDHIHLYGKREAKGREHVNPPLFFKLGQIMRCFREGWEEEKEDTVYPISLDLVVTIQFSIGNYTSLPFQARSFLLY